MLSPDLIQELQDAGINGTYLYVPANVVEKREAACKEVYRLYEEEGMEFKEIAQELLKSPRRIRQMYNYYRERYVVW